MFYNETVDIAKINRIRLHDRILLPLLITLKQDEQSISSTKTQAKLG